MKTVFVDVDTQLDFVCPAGALYVPGAERVLPAIGQLNRHAAARGIPVLSTVDAHTEDDAEFAVWPPHCVEGTWGQRKAEATLLERQAVIPNRAGAISLEGAQQIVLEKQTVDAFAAQTMRPVLEALGAERFVVYGVATEVCVLHAARRLLARGAQVIVVADATQGLGTSAAALACEEICSQSGRVLPLQAVLAE